MTIIQVSFILPLIFVAVWFFRRTRPSGEELLKGLALVFLNSIPAVAGLLTLYLLTILGVFPQFTFYPAPPLDPMLYRPEYTGIMIFTVAVVLGFFIAGFFRKKYGITGNTDGAKAAAIIVLFVISLLILLRNGYALIWITSVIVLWPFYLLIITAKVRR